MSQDWSSVLMSDQDIYTGYPYGIINKRANKLAYLAISNLHTDTSKDISTKDAEKGIVHPYLQLIDKSPSFSNFKFWHDISVFLDLEGVYYVMAVRNFENNNDSTRYGDIQDFEMLNPYNIRRVVNARTLELGGYVEHRNGLSREIPKEMIIEIKDLNPFDENDPYSMTDALTNAQFTLRQANDYTRHSLKNNLSAPGAISTDVVLEDQQFSNFVNRITNQEKGMPLFGNGAGSIKWDPMQIEMDKAALDKITDINRSELFAVSGVGKTNLAIEESGTTRETAKVQKDLLTEDHTIPKLQLIIDALNQDYKNKYPKEYEKTGYTIAIQSPLGVDKDSELKDIKVRSDTVALYNSMVDDGYNPEIAAQFINGEIQLKDIGMPQKPVSQKDDKTIIEEDKDDSRPSESGEKNALLIKNSQELIISTIESKLKSLEDKINNKIVINVEKEKKITVDNAEKKAFNKGNPYRDPDGKFTFGPTGSDSSLVSIINTSSTTIQKLNDDLTDLKKDAAGLEQKRFGLDTNSKESKDLEKLHDKNIDLQYETLGKITKARANLKTHVDNYFASEGIEPITLEQKVKQWGDGEWMDSIGPTIAKKPTADMFSKTEVDSMKKLNAQLYPSSVTVYRGMSVSPETKSITFKKNEIVSFSDSKRAAERFGKAKFDDRSLGITISKKIKPSEIIISHKWGSAYSSQVSMNAEIAVSFDAETKIDISKNEFDKSENTAKDLIGPLNKENLIEEQQTKLEEEIVKIQKTMIKNVISRVTRNDFKEQDDIILSSDRKKLENDLETKINDFYVVLILLYGTRLFNNRKFEFGTDNKGKFIINKQVGDLIKQSAEKASKSHIDTILNDILDSTNRTYENLVNSELEKLIEDSDGTKSNDELFELARKKALEGNGQEEIIRTIKKEYESISTNRAKAIARTETNRAFNQSQYQADLQFLEDANLTSRAYKQWVTRSDEPCRYCIDLSLEPPIPFINNFRELGDTLSYTETKKDGSSVKRSISLDYEELSAGNAHVNCACVYVLLVKDEKGKFIQHFESDNGVIETIENRGYNPNRDKSGKFTFGPSGAINSSPQHIITMSQEEAEGKILTALEENDIELQEFDVSQYHMAVSRKVSKELPEDIRIGDNYDPNNPSKYLDSKEYYELSKKRQALYDKYMENINSSIGVNTELGSLYITEHNYNYIKNNGEKFLPSQVDFYKAGNFSLKDGRVKLEITENLQGQKPTYWYGMDEEKTFFDNLIANNKFIKVNEKELKSLLSKRAESDDNIYNLTFPAISRAESRALSEYNLVSAVNQNLRNGKTTKAASYIESAIDKTYNKPQTVYRGLRGEFATKVSNMKPGDTLVDKGFMSTSSQIGSTEIEGARKFGQSGVIMKINTNGGFGTAIDMDPYVSDLRFTGESEVLLNRNTNLEMVGAETRTVKDRDGTSSDITIIEFKEK